MLSPLCLSRLFPHFHLKFSPVPCSSWWSSQWSRVPDICPGGLTLSVCQGICPPSQSQNALILGHSSSTFQLVSRRMSDLGVVTPLASSCIHFKFPEWTALHWFTPDDCECCIQHTTCTVELQPLNPKACSPWWWTVFYLFQKCYVTKQETKYQLLLWGLPTMLRWLNKHGKP